MADGIGPRIAFYTCDGCSALKQDYWREPSGDGETWDSGTKNTCTATDRQIDGAYGAAKPRTPKWCPVHPAASQPQGDDR
jgi:hypothetical protein